MGDLPTIPQLFYPVIYLYQYGLLDGLPRWLNGKDSTCQCRRPGFDSWVGKIPWRRESQPTPVFLPGESHGQRTLAGYSPWGHKELDTTEHKHAQTPGYLFYNMGYNPILLYFVGKIVLTLALGSSFSSCPYPLHVPTLLCALFLSVFSFEFSLLSGPTRCSRLILHIQPQS